MAQGRVPFNAVAAGGAPPGFDTPEAALNAALLREQYRSLARLGPYVHGIVIVAALALFGATPTGSLLTGILLPTALIAVSVFRLSSWFKARASVELEALECVRRKVRAASVLGPTLTFAFALATAISTWQRGVVEFALALGLAPLVAIAAYFIIRMLDEHFRMFAEIVRSRFAIAEMQRVAEEAREAAMTIALTDDLTGLPNRRCFQSLLADTIRTGAETGEPFALGLIDLDGFKPINDLHGHPVGDDILRQVAERLAKAMNGRGSAARIGGDEFAILCNGVGARDEAVALGKEIQAIFATPFDVSPLGVRLSCACGFALFPSTAAEPDELVRLADAALYRAKASGSGDAAMFDTRAGRTAASRTAFENDLRRAFDGSERAGPVVDYATRAEAFTSLRA
jgi:diguanylate cyclase (GGDEF)-like protein